jgi:hypothetical protein
LDRPGNLASINGPIWFDLIRRAIIFILGVVVILYALISPGHDVAFLICGLILLGVLPIENWIRIRVDRKATRTHPEDELKR